ncbi:MAG: hypothetical protein H6908_00930 [Hyphomicrobiales bacterium]|nr:hypothetical protein [Rickettsiales bacterium]MCP5361195.1 hypothetical protein [Hyphomicrobiales bacterium]
MQFIIFPFFWVALVALPFFNASNSEERFQQNSPECAAAEHTIKTLIEQGAPCEEDRDCILISLGCPFGCQTAVNPNQVNLQELKTANQHYGNICIRCEYMCAAVAVAPACVDHRCTVQMPK